MPATPSVVAPIIPHSDDPAPSVDDADIQIIRKLVYEAAGIVLDDSKRALIVGRLGRRLRARGLRSLHEYVKLVTKADPDGTERAELVNCITTNKTSFFREAHHFDFLREQIEERMRSAAKHAGPRKLRIWSAGCSTGEEPYSIALTVADALGSQLAEWDVRILATDIDTAVLAKAERAVYGREQLADVPQNLHAGFVPVTTDSGPAWQVHPDIRRLVAVRRLNLIADGWPLTKPFDFIFCRNVAIYFDRATQAKLYPRFAALLEREGSFFAGHAENLSWLPELFVLLGNTVYVHAGAQARTRTGRPRPMGPTSPRTAPRPSPTSPSLQVEAVTRPAKVASPSPPSAPVEQATPPGGPSTDAGVPEISLQTGDVHASRSPLLLKTTLGSCIAVCLFDPVARAGGMNHFMLPSARGSADGSTRWGKQAMEALLRELVKVGADPNRLVAKIAGACNVIDVEFSGATVSEHNLRFVEQFLADAHIPIASRRIGGTSALEVRFRADTGDALARSVGQLGTRRTLEEERRYLERARGPLAPAHDEGIKCSA